VITRDEPAVTRTRRAAGPPISSTWPVELRGWTPLGDLVVLRPLVRSDADAFSRVRRENQVWLSRWEATSPDRKGMSRPSAFRQIVKRLDREAREGRMLPFAIVVGDCLIGQINVSNITYGSFRSCSVGYWVSESYAGRAITPTALALVGDYVINELGLHRVEVNIRPENAASLAVVRKLGFRNEGIRRHFLHIDGAWRDHRSFALTTEDLRGGAFMDRLTHAYHESHPRHTGARPR
jgi:ribosomal-protein-alanine N-acetyltransferase